MALALEGFQYTKDLEFFRRGSKGGPSSYGDFWRFEPFSRGDQSLADKRRNLLMKS